MSADHHVLRTWVRTAAGAPPEERAGLEVVAGEGVEDDHTRGGRRHVTLLLADDWQAATTELGQDVDPAARRANVLLSGGDAGTLLGRRLRIGAVELDVRGETKPCQVMDVAAPGLQDALRPDMRAGIWCTVRVGGRIAPGDPVQVLDPH